MSSLFYLVVETVEAEFDHYVCSFLTETTVRRFLTHYSDRTDLKFISIVISSVRVS